VTGFEIQRALDLPAPLPADERVLWIGSPAWRGIARNVFHLGALAMYFVAVIAAHVFWVVANGASWIEAAASVARLAPLGAVALGMFALLAWMIARTTCYAITDRRVIMRIGVALSLTMNIPFRAIASADLRLHADGSGDLPLSLVGNDRMAYLHLWPHARPWRLKKPVPMLVCVPDAARVGEILGVALRASLAATPVAKSRVEAAQSPRGVVEDRRPLVLA
jgi:hypothetical protein